MDWIKTKRSELFRVGMFVGVLLFIWQVIQVVQSFDINRSQTFTPLNLIFALILAIVAYFIQLMAWMLMMRSVGAPIGLWAVIQGYSLSFLPRYIPGVVWGYLSRSEWLVRQHNVSYSQSTKASILEVGTQISTCISIAFLCLSNSSLGIICGLAIFILSGFFWYFVLRYPDLWKSSTANALEARKPFVLWLQSSFLYYVFWIAHGAIIVMAGTMLDSSAYIPLKLSSGMFGLSWLAGFSALLVPAGFGVREATLGWLAKQYTPSNIEVIEMAAIASRILIILTELLALSLVFIIFVYQRKPKSPLRPSESYDAE